MTKTTMDLTELLQKQDIKLKMLFFPRITQLMRASTISLMTESFLFRAMRSFVFLLVLSLVLLATTANAAAYKWVVWTAYDGATNTMTGYIDIDGTVANRVTVTYQHSAGIWGYRLTGSAEQSGSGSLSGGFTWSADFAASSYVDGAGYANDTSPYTNATVENAPSDTDGFVSLAVAGTSTLSFEDSNGNPINIENLALAFASLNGNAWSFDRNFTILSYSRGSGDLDGGATNGYGFWDAVGSSYDYTMSKTVGTGAYPYTMSSSNATAEPHGTIGFFGAFNSLAWSNGFEQWQYMTVGIEGVASQVSSDTTAPTVTIAPSDGASNVSVSSNITISFNEEVRNLDDTSLTNTNVDTLITLKETNSSGGNIPFDATIDADNKVITINPTSDFASNQTVYVAIGASVEDTYGNAITAISSTFTTAILDTTAPTATFSPANGATDVEVDANITITFDEAIRLVDDSALTDSNVDALITLKETNSSGSNIAFDATISGNVITVNPSSDFSNSQQVYVAIGSTVEDTSDNAYAGGSVSFTAVVAGDDFATVLISNDDLNTTEGRDDPAVMRFSLAGQPTAPVVLTFTGDAQCSVSPSTLTFDADTFATLQTLRIQALNDEVVEGAHACQPTAVVTSTDTRFNGLAVTLATVNIADDLVDQVRDPLTNILQSDFQQTVATQSRQFGQIAKGALDRLRDQEDLPCGEIQALDVDGAADASEGAFNTAGTFNEDVFNCVTGVRKITQGSFAVNSSPSVHTQGIFTMTVQNEKRVEDNALRGFLYGGYLSSASLDGVATGEISGVGGHLGVYGANQLNNGLLADYYAAGSLGRHEFDLSFYAPTAPIQAVGDYSYRALYAGAGLSGELAYDSVMFRPRAGINVAYADASDADVSATQLGITDTGHIELDPVNGTRLFAEAVWVFGEPAPEDEVDGISTETFTRIFEVAPRVYCERGLGRDTRDCGYGGYISFNEHNERTGSDIAVTLDYESKTKSYTSFGLEFSYSRDVLDDAGSLVTRFGTDHRGNANLSQNLSFAF